MTDISPESELDDVRFRVNMRTSYLTTSAENLVGIESGSTKQTETPNTSRRMSIISGINRVCPNRKKYTLCISLKELMNLSNKLTHSLTPNNRLEINVVGTTDVLQTGIEVEQGSEL